jgi:hypothetical protein
MTDEEKKATQARLETDSNTKAPEQNPSPSVSHSEPSAVHSDQDMPPLANPSAAEPSTSTLQSSGHDHTHDHAHGHAADANAHMEGATEFGEVIGEKNWQDSFLAAVAVLVLCGFLCIGVVWSKLEPPGPIQPESKAN